jgi:hypothetical protein
MLKWLGIIVRTLWSVLHTQRVLATENLVLRQQLAILKQRHPRPRLTDADRLFWVILSRTWSDWRESLHIVQPETVVRWHRQGIDKLTNKPMRTPVKTLLKGPWQVLTS